MNRNAKPNFKVLSLDGGGSKGFYTLGLLEEIEKMVKKPLSHCFDLIFGTSTGAIIAALLAKGEEVKFVKALYEKHVIKIVGCHTAKARSVALESASREIFGDATFDTFQTNIGLVATRWNDERPIIFKNTAEMAHGSRDSFQPGFGCRIREAIQASCAAYPFFQLPEIITGKGDEILVGDGGFCANNPTLYAIADATRRFGIPPENLRVLSLGVGSYPEPNTMKNSILRRIPTISLVQKILGINTCSMETLRVVLFGHIKTVRISETFNEPKLATDFLETDMKKLNLLSQKGRDSFAKHETELRKLLF